MERLKVLGEELKPEGATCRGGVAHVTGRGGDRPLRNFWAATALLAIG